MSDPTASIPERCTVVLPASCPPHLAGLRLAYREAGPADAPALVLLHGIGSNSTGFRFVMGPLSRRFRVIAWDAPGYGGSDELPAEAPGLDDYPDALAGLLDALGIARCHLAGSSYGSLVAGLFAARHGARLRTLTLLAPTIGWGGRPPADGVAMVDKRLADLAALGPEGLARQRAPLLLAPDAPAYALAATHDILSAIRPRGYGQAARFIARADALRAARSITTPTLVLCGDQDRITPLDENARRIQAAIAGAELSVLAGVGHLIKIEAPARCVELVTDFIVRRGER